MDDATRTALDAETPVNPYSLLDALNTAAARTNAVWLLFLGLMAYLALAVGALTHRDLLLDAGIALPLLQTRIDLARFFVGAPALLALAHLAVIAQFVLLARKAAEFDDAVRLLESTDLRSHPLRLEVDSFFHVQAIAGPERSRVVGAILHVLGWLTLLLLPLALLVYLQVAFLPFHNATVTAVQAGIVLADLAVVLLAGVFLLRAETSFFRALLRLVLKNPGSVAFGLATVAGAAFVTVAAIAPATVPGAAASPGAPLLGVFPRHLALADASLVSDKALIGTRTISLRGRDLRFARLDRADLRQADLTGARLDGANLTGADLRGARLGCANASALQQPDGRAKAGCTSARAADFSAAQMTGASLAGADLRGARFDEAVLERADLSRAQMAGATFERAKLQRANLSGGVLHAASLLQASLQGAALVGARLEMADLSGAGLQGAGLAGAHLGGAILRGSDLEGAGLQRAKLYGSDLRGAKLNAADLAGAAVWRAVPPSGDAVSLADLANIAIKPPAAADIE
ncbi:MAG: pentapeptide repeat-containing protein, partial [Hyphomicrobiaceae bacterium]